MDVTITHPFSGLLKYAGFDVRGIFITNGDYVFPHGWVIAWGDNTTKLVNADGYIRLIGSGFRYKKTASKN